VGQQRLKVLNGAAGGIVHQEAQNAMSNSNSDGGTIGYLKAFKEAVVPDMDRYLK
jgi:hypothetical protein